MCSINKEMAHLHTLSIDPHIYVDRLEGDSEHEYYLYVGASEDYPRRFAQKKQGYDAFHSGHNDGWSTPLFMREHHRVCGTVSLQFVDGGKTCAAAEQDTFLQWFHIHDCDMNIVRGSDWCKPGTLKWSDRRSGGGRGMPGPTLREAYDRFVQSGKAAALDEHKEHYLGWIKATA